MKLSASGRSDTGRRSNNEDSFRVDTGLGLFLLSDGMGGHAAGEVASAMAIQELRTRLEPALRRDAGNDALEGLLAGAIHQANAAITAVAAADPDKQGMGTTLTALLLRAGEALLAHVGDSRLYRWRDGRLQQLSEDHSLVADQLRQGILTPEEAAGSSLRNILLQALGVTGQLELCRQRLPLQVGDTFLLCSDGLSDPLADAEIAAALKSSTDPDAVCAGLITRALAAGGKDNITTIIIRVDAL